ncbi:hypothetical protein C0Q70_12040 [Pomacea canaliculata]|uniref:CUB domain-containing protein n=1 Tax=Pomacea canaliculata TaxID=400727 RepID=A0A2T7P0F0_POMCA|nr:uncharacterized protein LOC112568326 isoform X2 [Pomacea canaliculata]PVD26892.1 hypothetical protein C0Q70_12040 [Pomacea canaliculata]
MVLHLMVALVLSAFLSQTECQSSCAQLEFDTLENTDTTLAVTKNSRVVLTFYINTDKCNKSSSSNSFVIQLSKVQSAANTTENLLVCDILLQQQNCTVRYGASFCRCRSHIKGIVQFSQPFNDSHDSEHVWSWTEQGKLQERKVRFHIVFGEQSGVSFLMLAVGMVVTFVASVVFTSVIAVCIVKYRKGYQKYEPLMKDQINYPGYDAIVCPGDGGSGVEYNDYEEVESAFLVIGTNNVCDDRNPYLPRR